MVEEPEANCHPHFQSKILEMLFEAYVEYGIKSVVETHSEYIIRTSTVIKLQGYGYFSSEFSESNKLEKQLKKLSKKEQAQKTLGVIADHQHRMERILETPFKLYFFDNNETYEIKYKENGRFDKEFNSSLYSEATSKHMQAIKFGRLKEKEAKEK